MNNPIELFTIGFTQKTVKTFFDTLVEPGCKRVVDTRINNLSQLAGFAKRKDLEFFFK